MIAHTTNQRPGINHGRAEPVALPEAAGAPLAAATANRPTAVLTGPGVIAGTRPELIRLPRAMISQDMVLTGLDHHPLTATAAMVWNGDLARPLQQILFDAADGIASPDAVGTGEHEPAAVSQ